MNVFDFLDWVLVQRWGALAYTSVIFACIFIGGWLGAKVDQR